MMQKKIWLVSREYAGVAEAGGVKNVTASLAEGLQKEHYDVTVFIPFYGCTFLNELKDFTLIPDLRADITSDRRTYTIAYAAAHYKGVRLVFIVHSLFTAKQGVYTYTEDEQRIKAEHVPGRGHADSNLLHVLFQKGVLEYGAKTSSVPDIIHCQDAAAALVPFIARNDASYAHAYKDARFILTIHNAGNAYRHEIESAQKAASLLNLPEHLFEQSLIGGRCEPYVLAEPYAALTTVSPWYAQELTDPSDPNSGGLSAVFARRGTRITGITNGISYAKYDPKNTEASMLPYAFDPSNGDFAGKYRCRTDFLIDFGSNNASPGTADAFAGGFSHNACTSALTLKRYGFLDVPDDRKAVFFSYHGRIVHQKGTDILAKAARLVLRENGDARFIVTGQGSSELEREHEGLAHDFPGKYLYLRGYDRRSARLCVAVSDFIVLPSVFEPCGLEDFIAQIYGTLPVAHACGGLRKIIDGKTGFLYDENTPQVLAGIMLKSARLVQNNPAFVQTCAVYASHYVQSAYAWDNIIKNEYIPFYENLK